MFKKGCKPWNKGKKVVQFCPKGHDTFVVGRNTQGHCKRCIRDEQRVDPTKNSVIKQFCPKGHDTFIVGREKSGGGCKQCRKDKHPLPRGGITKRFCIHGHDTFICGRVKTSRSCKECVRITKPTSRKKWEKNNPDKMRLARSKAKAKRKKRVVAWTDWDNIREFELNKPIGMTTDHIIPLVNDCVWGLHVSWNLQYMPKSLNSSKNNKCNLLKASEWYGKILEEAGWK